MDDEQFVCSLLEEQLTADDDKGNVELIPPPSMFVASVSRECLNRRSGLLKPEANSLLKISDDYFYGNRPRPPKRKFTESQ